MRVGVGLPSTIPGTPGHLLVEWAKAADGGPFSSLGVLDRVLYDNYDPFVSLGAAAAVTERITLATTILIAPLRAAPLIAKGAASIHAISGGRLVLGLGLGARRDDYVVTGARYGTRGRQLTQTLADVHALWEAGEIGPSGLGRRPTVLVGGGGGLAGNRMARYADGFIHNGGPPRAFLRAATEARAAWRAQGRPGQPLLWSMAYFQLGGCEGAGTEYLRHYYAFTGPFADKIAAGILTDRTQLVEFTEAYRDAGCDELVLFPTVPDLSQLHRLADVLAASGAAPAASGR